MIPFPAYSAAFFIALCGGMALTPLVRHIAVKYHYVAEPRADRWHQKTTGLFGGVSIFVSMTAAWLIAAGIFFHIPRLFSRCCR
ncbi:MAG: hypothetical protein R2861_06930 [Desulfobacterales bacterium]